MAGELGTAGSWFEDIRGDGVRAASQTCRRARARILSLRAAHITAALFFLVLAGAFYLRIANLDGPDLNIDEVLHVYAAQSIVAGHGPVLPSGYRYTRAALLTEGIALLGRFWGVNEWTARLPSVLFGCLTVVLVFVIGRAWYSNGAGLIAAFITAVAPTQIALSREARMYPAFGFWFLLFVFAFFVAFESRAAHRFTAWMPGRVRRWCDVNQVSPLMFVFAVAAFAVAKHLHHLMLVAATGPAAYVLAMAVIATAFGHRLGIDKRKYVAAAALLVPAGVAYAVIRNIAEWYADLRTPTWALSHASPIFYLRTWEEAYPLILPTLLLGAGFAAAKNAKATLYALMCFGVPATLLSAAFEWKSVRYISHLSPLMFVLFGVGAASVTSFLYCSTDRRARHIMGAARARLAAGAVTATAVLFSLGFMPWFREGIVLHRKMHGNLGGVYHDNWRAVSRYVNGNARAGDVVLASAPGLARYYGINMLLYYVANDSTRIHLEAGLRDSEGAPAEYIVRAPMLLDLQTLQQVFDRHPSGWIVSERYRFQPLPRNIQDLVESRCQRQQVSGAPTMTVWRWPK